MVSNSMFGIARDDSHWNDARAVIMWNISMSAPQIPAPYQLKTWRLERSAGSPHPLPPRTVRKFGTAQMRRGRSLGGGPTRPQRFGLFRIRVSCRCPVPACFILDGWIHVSNPDRRRNEFVSPAIVEEITCIVERSYQLQLIRCPTLVIMLQTGY
jgi:hypothetical protein